MLSVIGEHDVFDLPQFTRTGARGGIVLDEMPDVPPSFSVPHILEDASARRNELHRLPHAAARVEFASGRSGGSAGTGQGAEPLDPGLSFASVAASELRTLSPLFYR
jgi:hypothetical protein